MPHRVVRCPYQIKVHCPVVIQWPNSWLSLTYILPIKPKIAEEIMTISIMTVLYSLPPGMGQEGERRCHSCEWEGFHLQISWVGVLAPKITSLSQCRRLEMESGKLSLHHTPQIYTIEGNLRVWGNHLWGNIAEFQVHFGDTCFTCLRQVKGERGRYWDGDIEVGSREDHSGVRRGGLSEISQLYCLNCLDERETRESGYDTP